MKLTKGRTIGIVVAVVILAAAFWCGGSTPGSQGWTAQKPTASVTPAGTASPDILSPTLASAETAGPDIQAPIETTQEASPAQTTAPEAEPAASTAPTQAPTGQPDGQDGGFTVGEEATLAAELASGSSASSVKGDANNSTAQGMQIAPATGKDKYLTGPVPEGKPLPVEPETVTISDTAYTCTLSVRCDTILDNLDWLDPEKVELVPEDGVILPATQVTFYEGESVFNVLQREMKKAKIHMEFVNTPIYHSAYIEGIGNLYEFDCGELSGWVYKVNDWFPNYGCSRYALKDGDVVEWVYTCDLGADVGGSNSTGG